MMLPRAVVPRLGVVTNSQKADSQEVVVGFVRRRTRRRAMMVAGGLAYEAGRNRQAEQDAYAAPAPTYQEPPPAPPPPAPSAPDLNELERLGELHDSGVLTDEEFAVAKSRILGT